MLRHVIAPAHSFAQIPNAILRHPRLSPDAKTLLTWQLSLPASEKQCLSDTARRAGIKKCAFQKAKRQLLEERFLHQWTTRADGGRFVTVQLVSNTALSPKEALAVRDGLQPAPGGARLTRETSAQPSAAQRAARQPTGPAVGRLPKRNTRENTNQPTGPAPARAAESPAPATPRTNAPPDAGRDAEPDTASDSEAKNPPATHAAAEALLLSLGRTDPQLAMPVSTARRWAPLAEKWLTSGLPHAQIEHALTEGLAGARKPLGALHWRLQHALPEPPPPAPAAPKPKSRVTRMRECPTRHGQPRLFTPPPGSDEKLCRECRASDEPAPLPLSAGSGFAEFAAARQAQSSRSRPPQRPRSIHRHRRTT